MEENDKTKLRKKRNYDRGRRCAIVSLMMFFVIAIEPKLMLAILEIMAEGSPPLAFYLAPLLPLLSRGAVFLKNCDAKMRNEPLTPAEMAREPTRALILAMAGFSFTGLMGIVVLDNITRHYFKIQIFYLLVSFLCYLNALQLQDYKFLIIREMASDTLIDVATLGLLCTVVSLVLTTDYGYGFKATILGVAFFGWVVDHAIRIRYVWQDYNAKRKEIDDEKRTTGPIGSCF